MRNLACKWFFFVKKNSNELKSMIFCLISEAFEKGQTVKSLSHFLLKGKNASKHCKMKNIGCKWSFCQKNKFKWIKKSIYFCLISGTCEKRQTFLFGNRRRCSLCQSVQISTL